ncbi:hypothetical protein LPN01_16430 [Sphingomonas sp. A2-49]|uniref:hypothetical protein n=1 Tax=Sphingomonas sp. A2-49 TaxID=1391375 RepID=UPI0021D23CE6|nr:hypothetical protein [Sphingomonas sp. A2-49]MCU6455668.1 hypothetical protein [Sphingomonas sp. A2-49]
MSRHGLGIAAALGIAAIGATPVLGADKNRPAHVFGPPPSWDAYRAIAEAGLKERLVDPESARITWAGGFFKGEFKPLLAGRIEGYVACGAVNARNRMGGYSGATSFVTVVDYDRVLYVEIDRVAGGMIAGNCNKSARAGLLPPLPTGAAASAVSPMPPAVPASAASASVAPAPSQPPAASGLTLRAMPDGAYISAVAAASPAAAVGLKPGMVNTSVNAIPLTGMGEAMVKIIDATGTKAVFTLVGGRTVTLGARP